MAGSHMKDGFSITGNLCHSQGTLKVWAQLI